MVGSSSPLSFSTSKVLKCVQGQGSNSPGAAGWNPRMGVFFTGFFPTGRAKQEPHPPKKTGWNTHHMNGEDKLFQLFLSVSFLGMVRKIMPKSGFTSPTTRSLKHQQDWLHTIIQSFPPSVGSNFNPSTSKQKRKSTWIIFPQKKVSK